MKNELQVKVIGWLETAAQSIGDFAKEQIPPFIHEYLNWKFMEAGFGVVMYFALAIFWLIISFFLYKLGKKNYNKIEDKIYCTDGQTCSYMMPYCLSGIIIIFSLGNFTFRLPKEEIKDMVQIKVAPKVYLIEQASKIIKENK